MQNKISLSVIIPCFNEEDRIQETITEVMDEFKDLDLEIICVDDGSQDKTFQKIIEKVKTHPRRVIGIRSEINKGKGFAFYEGVRYANKSLILLLDADLSVPPKELKRINLKTTYDLSKPFIVKGQRIQFIPQPFYRIAVGKCWKLLVFLFTGIYQDTQCPFTLLNVPKEFFNDLCVDGFAFDVELLVKAKHQKIPIHKIDVTYYNDFNSTVTFKKTRQMFYDLLRIRKIKKKK